jgi:glycosyltransferase involved in cell wall biosynthesis
MSLPKSANIAGPSAPHVCFVAPNAYPVLAGRRDLTELGGAQVQQSILARALVRSGIKVTFICMNYGQDADITIDGIRILRVFAPDEGLRGLRFIHPRMTTLWSAMSKANADVYYQRCSGVATGVVAAYSARNNKPFIFAGASDLDFTPGPSSVILPGRRDRAIYRWGLKGASAVIAQNSRQMKMLAQNYGLDGVLIPSCYDNSSVMEHDQAKTADEILWVGMLRPGKRPELFLDMARRLPHLTFRMIGGAMGQSPETLSFYENTRQEAERIPNLKFMGFVPYAEIDAYFDKARVFVNTSEHEGFPNTFLQAWARKIPSVAFFDTGSRLGEASAYLIIRNIEEAVEGIRRLMSDQNYHAAWAIRCAEFFNKNHSPAIAVAQYRALFDSLLTKISN